MTARVFAFETSESDSYARDMTTQSVCIFAAKLGQVCRCTLCLAFLVSVVFLSHRVCLHLGSSLFTSFCLSAPAAMKRSPATMKRPAAVTVMKRPASVNLAAVRLSSSATGSTDRGACSTDKVVMGALINHPTLKMPLYCFDPYQRCLHSDIMPTFHNLQGSVSI